MRQIAVLSVALVVSLVGAYLTWTDDSEEVSDETVLVYNASDKDLKKLTWKSDTLDVSIERRSDDQGEYLWVESTETRKAKKPKKPKKPDGHDHEDEDEAHDDESPEDETPAEPEPVADTPEAEPEPVVTTLRFLGNKSADELWTSFAPLQALRRLDTAGVDLSLFGFEAKAPAAPVDGAHPEGEPSEPVEPSTVEVVRGSGSLTLTVGGETYGSKDRYVRYNDAVYLVDDATLRPLQFASSRLVERSLFPFEEADIEQVDVSLPAGASYSFFQQNRDDRAKAYWARADALDQEDDVAGTWLGKVFKLRLRDYVDESELKGTPEPVLSYTVQGKGKRWKIDIVKVETQPTPVEGSPILPPPASETSWYARSAYNRSLVSLTESLVRNVIDDLDSLEPSKE